MLYIPISNRNIYKCKCNIFEHVTVSDMLYIYISNRNIYKCKGNILKYVTVTQCRNADTTIDRG